MANWSTLKAAIASVIKNNGNQEITGQVLQNVLNNIVSSIGENATFAGVATPNTNPGVPDGNVFYFAAQAGTYTNFGGIQIADGEAVILEWRGSWVKKTTGFATQQKLSDVSNKSESVNYVVCSTASETGSKSVTISGITALTSNIRLLIKMTNNNTANNDTHSINLLGAKLLYYDNERVYSDNSWEAGETVDVYYDGTNFYASNVQGGSGSDGNMILEWNTDAATTRKQVPLKDRKLLLII